MSFEVSGLGLELRLIVFVNGGKGADALERRPQLAAALAEAKRRKGPVVIASWIACRAMCISSRA